MSEQVKLEKSLSPLQVCALALGSIVGWGCFVLPGDMFLPQAGPVGTLLGFFVGACLISFVAVCLSYMVKYAPVAGGAFAYAYIGFGPRAAFVCGWALVIGYLAIVAIDIAALSVIFRFLFPGVFEFGELYSIAGWTVYSGEVILMTAGTFFFGYINYRGIGFAGALQLILAFMLTFGILALFGGVLALDTASVANLSPAFSDKRSMIACVLLVFAISPFLFVGFDTVPQAAEEFAFDPSRARNIMVVAIFCGVLLYAMVMLSVGMAVPYPELLAKLDAQRATGGVDVVDSQLVSVALGKVFHLNHVMLTPDPDRQMPVNTSHRFSIAVHCDGSMISQRKLRRFLSPPAFRCPSGSGQGCPPCPEWRKAPRRRRGIPACRTLPCAPATAASRS